MFLCQVTLRGVLALTAVFSLAAVGAHGQVFEIVSASSGLVLDVPNSSTQPGQSIQQWSANGGTNQQWVLRHNPSLLDGYEIVSLNSGMVLDVPNFSTQPGQSIQQWRANGGTNQRWMVLPRGPDLYTILSENLSWPILQFLVLDVPNFSTQPGQSIQQWPTNGGVNEEWTFRQLGPASISVRAQGGYLKIKGTGFTKGSHPNIYYLGRPGRSSGYRFQVSSGTVVGADESFIAWDFPCRGGCPSQNPNDAFGYVGVVAEDLDGKVVAVGSVSATYFVQ